MPLLSLGFIPAQEIRNISVSSREVQKRKKPERSLHALTIKCPLKTLEERLWSMADAKCIRQVVPPPSALLGCGPKGNSVNAAASWMKLPSLMLYEE